MPLTKAIGTAEYDVVYQGQPGAFSEDATFDFVSRDSRLLGLRTLQDVFDSVARGQAPYAVIPVENTLAGPIDETYDLLAQNDLVIIDETVQTISHCLIVPKGTPIEDVTRVLSHPVALAQCEQSLKTHLKMEPVPAFDTAGAVELVIRDKTPHTGAIGSARSADVYGGEILLSGIQDHPENYTRFLLMCTPDNPAAERPSSDLLKTSVCFQVPHSKRRDSGVLRPFVECGIPLTNVLSRPVRGSDSASVYHVDFIGTMESDGVVEAIAQLKRGTREVKIIGTYPLRVATIREVVRSGLP
jgi:prephenate dehydratase